MRGLFSTIALATVIAAARSPSAPSRAEFVYEQEVVASKFAFEPAVIRVTAGERVRLVIHSADVVHGFAIAQLKIDVQLPRGSAPASVEFTAPPPGRYEITCSQFCGSGHGRMKAALVSVPQTSARSWISKG